ncbi:hypothetical protein V6N11_024679 [Hibiscus sabdariffa]|uniref:Cytochrome P450 n=1 Tax=Hibiscus sabdariffa TaxID=183260 RepID=A0ABR2QND2_9ROSI
MELFPVMFWVALAGAVCYYTTGWVKSQRLRKKLCMQGITGPPPSFLYGNVPEMKQIQSKANRTWATHDYASTLFPYMDHWRKQYVGQGYVYDQGTPTHAWQWHYKIQWPILGPSKEDHCAPVLHGQGHGGAHGGINSAVAEKWEAIIDANGGLVTEFNVDGNLRSISADVIVRACFGSSYVKGKQIFSKLRTIQTSITKQGFLFGLNSSRFLPNNKKVVTLEREVELLIWETMKQRQQECLDKSLGQKDLMQLILESAMNDESAGSGKGSPQKFIVDNCKNIYFAGHETTAITASWCLMLLALHPEWQSRIQEEVAQVCTNGLPNADSISRLKTVNTLIYNISLILISCKKKWVSFLTCR